MGISRHRTKNFRIGNSFSHSTANPKPIKNSAETATPVTKNVLKRAIMKRLSANSSVKLSKPTNAALYMGMPNVGCQSTKLSHIEMKEGTIKRNKRKHSTGTMSQTANGTLSISFLRSDRSVSALTNSLDISGEFISLDAFVRNNRGGKYFGFPRGNLYIRFY